MNELEDQRSACDDSLATGEKISSHYSVFENESDAGRTRKSKHTSRERRIFPLIDCQP